MLKQRSLHRKRNPLSWALASSTWLYIYWTHMFWKSSCSLHRKLWHVDALLLKGYSALSRSLVSDFLLFNVLFSSSIKKFKVMGSQILESWVLSLGSWVPGPSTWVLGPKFWVLGLGSWVLILDYARKNLCFTEFSTKIHWNTLLAVSDVFHMLTQSIKFF